MVEKNQQNTVGVFSVVRRVFPWRRSYNPSNTNTIMVGVLGLVVGVILGYTPNMFRHDIFSNTWQLIDKHYYGTMPSSVAITFASLGALGDKFSGLYPIGEDTPSASISAEWIDGMLFVRVTQFTSQTAIEFRNVIDRIDDAIPIVIDLQNNVGGVMDTAMEIADIFIEDGVLTIEETRTGRRLYRATAGALDNPLFVCINRKTFSAGEALAGVLQYYQVADVVGEDSYGKTSVQRAFDVGAGWAVVFTVGQWMYPDGSMGNVSATVDMEGLCVK